MNKTIIAIDDQPDIRKLIRMTLEFKDFQVIEADSGEAGLALVRQHRPDLILLDVMMPGLDGFAVSNTLAADPELRRIPVVMLTALDRPKDVEAGLHTGARAYLTKPFSPMALIQLVGRLSQEAPPSDAA
ncbi:response regulator [Roseateles amylovorans]|uniref:Response regulator n=1 Tax=Roseateles amylovorans TaxID=2978473 RepID=A0ABY6AWI6_9BURK|nr:response regulator [Roseateles amylovorans]UXH76764.1 response regulator [Roseateles amylovorans]